MYFWIYGLPNTSLNKCPRKSRSRGPPNSWHGKRAGTLLKSERQNLYHIYWSLWTQFSWKKSPLMTFKVLGLFVNPLPPDDKYFLLNRGNLLQHFQMQLCQKRKKNSHFLLTFSKFRLYLEHFQKKVNLTDDVVLNLLTPKYFVR